MSFIHCHLIVYLHFQKHDYVAGNHLTIADLFGISELQQLIALGYNITRGRHHLAVWMERGKNELSPHFDDVHTKIMQFGGKFKMEFGDYQKEAPVEKWPIV